MINRDRTRLNIKLLNFSLLYQKIRNVNFIILILKKGGRGGAGIPDKMSNYESFLSNKPFEICRNAVVTGLMSLRIEK